MKFIQGVAGEERVLLALTPYSMSQHEVAVATRTNLIEGFTGKHTICKLPLNILLPSLLLRLGWSTVSYGDITLKSLEKSNGNDKSLGKHDNLNQKEKSEGKI